MQPRRLAPLARRSLALTAAAALALAPLGEAAATQPLGARLRAIMTLSPGYEAPAEPEAAAPAEPAPTAADAPEAEPEDALAGAPEAPPAAAEAAPVEGPDPADPEPRKGLGMMITGAVITGAYALPMTLFGTYVILASSATGDSDVLALGGVIGGTILFFGVAGLGVGVPLLGVGASRFRRWRAWKERHPMSLTPSAGATAFGTITPGLTVRF